MTTEFSISRISPPCVLLKNGYETLSCSSLVSQLQNILIAPSNTRLVLNIKLWCITSCIPISQNVTKTLIFTRISSFHALVAMATICMQLNTFIRSLHLLYWIALSDLRHLRNSLQKTDGLIQDFSGIFGHSPNQIYNK